MFTLSASDIEIISGFGDIDGTAVGSYVGVGRNNADALVLMGASHMVLGYRPPDDRYGPVGFSGWYGCSKLSDELVGAVTDSIDHILGGAPSWSQVEGDPDVGYLSGIEGTDTDYSGLHRTFRNHVKL